MIAFLESFSPMSSQEILIRAKWDNAGGINVIMRDVIMAFDVIKIDSVGDSLLLIQIFEVPKEMGIIHDTSNVAFKVSMIHGIKSD